MRPRTIRTLRRSLVAALVPLLVATLGPAVPVPPAQRSDDPRGTTRAVPLNPVKGSRPDSRPNAPAAAQPAPAWPPSGSAEVDLRGLPTGRGAPADGFPVRVAATEDTRSGRVRVESLPRSAAQAAGLSGPLFRLTGTAGGAGGRVGRSVPTGAADTVTVHVDYSSFRTAYGGDWSSRLRLIRLPDCAATTPGAAACQPVDLGSRLDPRAPVLSADVPLGGSAGTLVAVTAASGGKAGDFTATDLAPSSSWSQTGATGGFSWSYPMRIPPGPYGPAPQLALSYSSQSVDGRQSATNNQPSWLGEGFEYSPGYIERRYRSCADDKTGTGVNNPAGDTGDLCWSGPVTQTDKAGLNGVLSLWGASKDLVRGADGRWHPVQDDGSRIELLSDPSRANGDQGDAGTGRDGAGEYWKVTTSDGTQYFFGSHKLPGWSTGRPTTDSVLTVPVFGNHPGEPCYQAGSFGTSSCQQAYRWYLDYVVDPHGNSMSLWWGKETNHYARNKAQNTPVAYDRSGYLKRIDYGTDNRDSTEYASAAPFVDAAPGRIEFTTADRCLVNCGTRTPQNWPDTPWDQNCGSTGTCSVVSPTFWSTRRLTTVLTRAGGVEVDRWDLEHTFPDPGDGTHAGLWLAGVRHTGLGGSRADIALPKVTFDPIAKDNRVDTFDHSAAFRWQRLGSIHTESGAEIVVTYSDPQCVAPDPSTSSPGNLPAPDNNRMRCFPVKWAPEGYPNPVQDWFHKYVVTGVDQIDHTGGGPLLRTAYSYENPSNLAMWHRDLDDRLVPASRLTWGQWRGYPTVVTTVGEGTEATKTETLYFRGMHGDQGPGGTRTVSVGSRPAGAFTDQPAVVDHDAFAGLVRESVTWRGSQVIAATLYEPWQSDPTASRGSVHSRYLGTASTLSRLALDSGGWRTTKATSRYDSFGMEYEVAELGDPAVSTDDKCSRVEYARNTTGGAWQISAVSRARGWAGACSAPPAPGDATAKARILSDVRNYFDGATVHGTAPTKGLLTRTEKIVDWNTGTGPVYRTATSQVYDAAGRVTELTDEAGRVTKTAYTPQTGGPLTAVRSTNPLGWDSTSTLDPAWGAVTQVRDVNNEVTTLEYDGLGRLRKSWLPGRSAPLSPNTEYLYDTRNDRPSTRTTRALNAVGGYDTTYTVYDALLRPRQTQTTSVPDGTAGSDAGRIVSDTFYDSAGRVWKSNEPYFAQGVPDGILRTPLDKDVPAQNRHLFDAAGRPVASVFYSRNVEQWRTTTAYKGDRTEVTPPDGGTLTSTVTDALGRTSELRTYRGSFTGPYDTTRYRYDPRGLLESVTDPAGNVWSYGYDLEGRQIRATDPDRGTTESTYNVKGELETQRDSRGTTLAWTYDGLGRTRTVRDGSTTGPVRVEWTYDSPKRGVTASATRYADGSQYINRTLAVDAQLRPLKTEVVVPLSEGALAGTYRFESTYRADGSPNTVTLPAVTSGGSTVLSAEKLTFGYDARTGLSDTLATDYGDVSHYVVGTGYTALRQVNRISRATAPTDAPSVNTLLSYEESTGRLSGRQVQRNGPGGHAQNTEYRYDPAGNLRSTVDTPTGGGTDRQCYLYDHLRRITDAWTAAENLTACSATPPTAASAVGGPAPYWMHWEYDKVGNRTRQDDRTPGRPATTTTYTYPTAGQPQPHTLIRESVAVSGGTPTDRAYTYDAAGNTRTRPGAGATQTLTWDPEGKLSELTEGAGTHRYVYDANGSRLITRDPTTVTLDLGVMQVTLNRATNQVGATRYYSFAGEVVAQRTGTGTANLRWLAGDQQGTGELAITADAAQTVTRRRFAPFGVPRGASGPTWVNPKTFVGGEQDASGLVHLGAREYDPKTGRFVSVDPVLDFGDPQQMHGYAYAENNPTTFSDPSGLRKKDASDEGGGCISAACQAAVTASDNLADKQKQKTHANQVKQKSFKQYLAEVGKDVVKVFIPIDEIEGCFSKGDWLSCGALLLELVPIGKIITGAKRVWHALEDAWNAWKDFRHARRQADEVLSRIDGEIAAAQEEVRAATSALAKERAAVKPDSKSGNGSSNSGPGCATSGHSFDPDTEVRMADGSTKRIEDVKVGDRVLATDPVTGETTGREVTRTWANLDNDLTDLVLVTEDGVEVVETTQHHPFWSETRQQWVDAGELSPGEQVESLDGAKVTVLEVRNRFAAKVMHDLTVDTVHTYHVLAGATPVLVHNCGDTDLGDGPEADAVHETTPYRAGMSRKPRHHVFPQEHRAWFEDRGFDIDKVTVELDEATHQAIHGGGNWRLGRTWSGEWNSQIMGRLNGREAELGRQLTPREIWKIGYGMARQYKLPKNFVHYHS